MRGRRDSTKKICMKTRPDVCRPRKGLRVLEVNSGTNYFTLIAKPNWRLLLYRVDMKPTNQF